MRRILSVFLITIITFSFHAHADEGASKLERTKALIAENQSSIQSDSNLDSQPSGIKAARGLAITIGIFLLGAFLYQKLIKNKLNKQSSSTNPVLTKLRINHNSELSLVELDGKKFVVLISGNGVALHPWGEG